LQSLGKYLIMFGAIILIAGVIIAFFPKLNFFGKLPGDIAVRRENFTFYFPIVTSIVISVLFTLIFWVINYFLRK
jgi:hypothetical protein